ncbi:MAG: hypothetical protein C0512_14605 [Flavobacterium sp.]|nr:hypothetical protein [Flavobacterium sp.]
MFKFLISILLFLLLVVLFISIVLTSPFILIYAITTLFVKSEPKKETSFAGSILKTFLNENINKRDKHP